MFTSFILLWGTVSPEKFMTLCLPSWIDIATLGEFNDSLSFTLTLEGKCGTVTNGGVTICMESGDSKPTTCSPGCRRQMQMVNLSSKANQTAKMFLQANNRLTQNSMWKNALNPQTTSLQILDSKHIKSLSEACCKLSSEKNIHTFCDRAGLRGPAFTLFSWEENGWCASSILVAWVNLWAFPVCTWHPQSIP